MITAIQTAYDGCLFRSRLEARWAVVFNTLGLSWRYEPEGFELSDGRRYLPDFFLDSIGWVEIKPTTDLDDQKWLVFCEDNGKQEGFRAFRFTGDVPAPFDAWPVGLEIEAFYGGMHGGGTDNFYALCLCPTCGKIGIEYEGRGERICRHTTNDKGRNPSAARLLVAYIAGRSARFEGPQYNGIDI